MSEFNEDNMTYPIENLIAICNEDGTFFDFALNSGHIIITDYSLIENEIVCNNKNIALGIQKEKKKVVDIKSLQDTISSIMFQIRVNVDKVSEYILDNIEPDTLIINIDNVQSRSSDIDKAEVHSNYSEFSQLPLVKSVTNQVTFDILYSKFCSESPMLTLHEYCSSFLNYEWMDSLRELLDSKDSKISESLHKECIRALYPNSFSNKNTSSLVEEIYKKVRKNGENYSQEKIDEYLDFVIRTLEKAKDAAYHAIIEEIKREAKIIDSDAQRADAVKLGIDPDIYIEYLTTLNERWKNDFKKPKIVWDYLYYNSCPELITSKQFKRNFRRDSNTSYEKFVVDFNRYDRFIDTIIAKPDDSDCDYFHKSMNYYHLEIYKRLDFCYKTAKVMEQKEFDSINKNHHFLKRFHPMVFLPSKNTEHNMLSYGEKFKYYLPFLSIDNPPLNIIEADDNINLPSLDEVYALRAKAYELFKYHYTFDSLDYKDISDFLRNCCNVASYHESNKKWKISKSEGKNAYNKALIKYVLAVNDALFDKRR